MAMRITGFACAASAGCIFGVLLLAGGLLAGSAFAQPQAKEPEGQLRCMVNGYDVVLINDSSEEIPAGTVVAWSVPRVRVGADYSFSRPLPPSQSHFMTAVMGANYTSPRVECEVEVREPSQVP